MGFEAHRAGRAWCFIDPSMGSTACRRTVWINVYGQAAHVVLQEALEVWEQLAVLRTHVRPVSLDARRERRAPVGTSFTCGQPPGRRVRHSKVVMEEVCPGLIGGAPLLRAGLQP